MSYTKKQRAAYMRDYRRRKKVEAIPKTSFQVVSNNSEVLAQELQSWSRNKLVVPYGHADAGLPMEIPQFGLDFIIDALKCRESLLCVARKNGKSAIIAVYLLARLAGPLLTKGYRAGVCSVNREKASELYDQCKQIALCSKLENVTFRTSPMRIIAPFGTVDILSADRSAGHASGFDDAIADELGLFPERKRDLVNGLRSSVSARNGRFIALSILGDSSFTKEMIERSHLETTAVHNYVSKDNCLIDDVESWRQSNPGLGTIKSMQYMKDESARCLYSPADEKSFRAFDLNQPYSPTREMICSVSEYEQCTSEEGFRGDRCYIGIDIGGSNSMTAAVVIYPDTNYVETFAAFAGIPNLRQRGNEDGVGDLYERMAAERSLIVFDGYRVTPVTDFLKLVFDQLQNVEIVAVGADRFRKNEVVQAFEKISRVPNLIWRGVGASQTADGSHDVRAMQRAMKNAKYKMKRQLTWINAIAESEIRYDVGGNPALDKRRRASRIDVLQAGVIAYGLAELYENVNPDAFSLKLC